MPKRGHRAGRRIQKRRRCETNFRNKKQNKGWGVPRIVKSQIHRTTVKIVVLDDSSFDRTPGQQLMRIRIPSLGSSALSLKIDGTGWVPIVELD